MRASLTIQYDPQHPAEVDEVKLMLNASDWKLVAWDLSQYIYERLNHGTEYGSGIEELEKVREELYNILREYNLSLEG